MSLIFFPASGVGFTGFGNWWGVDGLDGLDWTGLMGRCGRWTVTVDDMDDGFAHGRMGNGVRSSYVWMH